ncbi:MAG TPA: diguanylate cyclase [Methylomirabilota bacterium]|nr:diguanylate cyclase [Methylomirabilota bacterium]
MPGFLSGQQKQALVNNLFVEADVATPGVDPSQASTHLGILLRHLPIICWTADERLRITSHSGPPFLRRHAPRRLLGSTIDQYFRCSREDQAPIKQHLDALLGIPSKFELRRRERIFDMAIDPLRAPDGCVIGCAGMALDVTEQRISADEIRYQATHDGLTGLANHRAFFDALEREVLRAHRAPSSFALVLFDLDGLKGINDGLGHLAGNHALQRVAVALRTNCRASDLAARFGGDEFAALLLDSDADSARQMAERVAARLREVPPHPPLGISVGIAAFPSDAPSSQGLFEVADQRLYLHKRRAQKRCLFEAVAATAGRLD